MLNKIFLAIIQAATEFLPVSSSGHLAIISNLNSEPDICLFTSLHLASLIAVVIFERREILNLISFNKGYRRVWLYLAVGTIPAAAFGYFFKGVVENAFSSFLLIGIAYIFTAFILFLTKFTKVYSKLNLKNSFIIGLSQVLGLFPGVSRSGIVISSALFSGVDREKATKFSFLLFIPLSLGAFIVENPGVVCLDIAYLVPFIICLVFSLLFLNILLSIVKSGKLWMFSVYCIIVGVVSLFLHFK